MPIMGRKAMQCVCVKFPFQLYRIIRILRKSYSEFCVCLQKISFNNKGI